MVQNAQLVINLALENMVANMKHYILVTANPNVLHVRFLQQNGVMVIMKNEQPFHVIRKNFLAVYLVAKICLAVDTSVKRHVIKDHV